MSLVRLTRDEENNLIVAATDEQTTPLRKLRARTIETYSTKKEMEKDPNARLLMARRIRWSKPEGANAYEIEIANAGMHYDGRSVEKSVYPILFFRINEHQYQRAVLSERERDELTIIFDNQNCS